MTTIGDKEVAFEKTFLCQDNESASFDVNLHGTNIKFVVRFVPIEPGLEGTVKWTVTPQQISIDFVGWGGLYTAAAYPSPVKIGQFGDQVMGIQIAYFRLGVQNLAHFSVLLGGHYD